MSINREKTALVVFTLCIVLGFAALCTYLFFGHNWNVVASKVDDVASDMAEYTVVCYKGVGIPDDDAAADDRESGKSSKSSKASSKSSSSKSSSSKSSSKKSSKTKSESKVVEIIIPAKVSAVADDYVSKKASVLTISSKKPKKYARGVVKEVGDKKVGIAYFKKGKTAKQMQRVVDKLRDKGVDWVFAFAPSNYYMRNVTDVDVVISLNKVPEKDKAPKGKYYAPRADKDSVVAIIINKHKVITSKVIKPEIREVDKTEAGKKSSKSSKSSSKSTSKAA